MVPNTSGPCYDGRPHYGRLKHLKEETRKKLTVNIVEDNYILSQYLDFNHMLGGNAEPKKYDFVIGNPPYMKIPKDAPEATAMPEVCYGAPNLYFIFASMGLLIYGKMERWFTSFQDHGHQGRILNVSGNIF